MAYCTRDDLEAIAGVGNVTRWSDLDNDRSKASIATRITAAIADAQTEVDARLDGGVYTVPFDDDDVPSLIRRATSLLALADLQLARGKEDDSDSQGNTYRDRAESMLSQIREGKLRLLDETRTLSCPEILTEE